MSDGSPITNLAEQHNNKDKLSHKEAVIALTQILHLYHQVTFELSTVTKDQACDHSLVLFFQASDITISVDMIKRMHLTIGL